ncbi:MAG: hypothetical protein ABSE92_06790 [Terriglobales bacterium]
MKTLFLPLALLPLMFAAGCGGGPSGSGGGGTGTFSNSSLNGQYAYRLTGLLYNSNGSTSSYAEAGTFSADGGGHITAGVDDLVVGGTALATSTSVTGTYSVNGDGTGSITLNNAGLGTETLAITLASSSKLYIIEQDPANTFGVAELQSSSTLTTVPSGTFTFRIHDQGTASRAGAFTVNAGTIAGSEDLLAGGNLDNGTGAPLPITGSLLTPTGGRGTGSFNDGLSTVQFVYYVVDANNIRILRTDSGLVSLGRAETQTGTFTSNAAFKGSYAFGSRADDTFSINGQNTVGVITADGNGAITGGAYDAVIDGSPVSNAAITSGGTYTVGQDGSVVVNFTTSTGASIQQIFWLVSPSRAFFLTNDSTKYEDGIADLQQSSSFTNTSINGQYAFVMDGFVVSTANIDRVGWISGDGGGNMSWYEGVNSSGTYGNPGTLTGTYSVATNGRATATINGLSQGSNDLVFYLVSGSQAYILQDFSGYEVIGAMDLQ